MKQINKFDLAISVGYDFQIEEKGFKDMSDNSVKAIELSFDDYSNFDFKCVKKLADAYDVSLWSLHLPFMPFDVIDISSTDNNTYVCHTNKKGPYFLQTEAETAINTVYLQHSQLMLPVAQD